MNLRSYRIPIKQFTIFAVILIVGLVSNGNAGGPQPTPGNFILDKSKGVDGLLTAVVVDPESDLAYNLDVAEGQGPFVVQTIVLTCKKTQVFLGPAIDEPSSSPDDLAITKAECISDEEDPNFGTDLCLEGWILLGAGADLLGTECFPNVDPSDVNSPVDLSITRVRNFVNTGDAISAEVVLRLGRPRPMEPTP